VATPLVGILGDRSRPVELTMQPLRMAAHSESIHIQAGFSECYPREEITFFIASCAYLG